VGNAIKAINESLLKKNICIITTDEATEVLEVSNRQDKNRCLKEMSLFARLLKPDSQLHSKRTGVTYDEKKRLAISGNNQQWQHSRSSGFEVGPNSEAVTTEQLGCSAERRFATSSM